MTQVEESKEEMGSLDFISKLPEFILQQILSLLDREEACRASIVSKQWYEAWTSMPVLDFPPEYVKNTCLPAFKYNQEFYDVEKVECYARSIDTTMKRYSIKNHFIKKFNLEFPWSDDDFGTLIGKWIRIAVNCGIEELILDIFFNESMKYKLPEILFSAEKLKKLDCRNVMLPYYVNNKVKSLVSLRLSYSSIDESMLQQILASCDSLIELYLCRCNGLQKIWIPWVKKSTKSLDQTSLHSDVNGSTLQEFFYQGATSSLWPCEINASALRNLTGLHMANVAVTDDIVSVLASELPLLEILILSLCSMLKNIEVSSKTLKTFQISRCEGLETVNINAPDMVRFRYIGAPRPYLSVMNAQVLEDCIIDFQAQQHPSMEMFNGLQNFLLRSNIFKIMLMDLAGCNSEVVDVEEDFLKEISFESCYRLEEVYLIHTCRWNATSSSLPAFLDCLFWSCRPNALTMHTTLSFQNDTMKNAEQKIARGTLMTVSKKNPEAYCLKFSFLDSALIEDLCFGVPLGGIEGQSEKSETSFETH